MSAKHVLLFLAAAMMLVAADYAGGVALSTIFHGVPIVGFHPLSNERSAYLWGSP